MIQITRAIAIDENEIQEEFIRASGPGGQNVNKVATAVQIRFDVANSHSLPDDVKKRLMSLGRGRMTDKGVLIIDARRFRLQSANREDAIGRLVELIGQAAVPPQVRHRTRPTPGSKVRRLESKKRHAGVKRLRGSTPETTDI